MRGAGLQLEAIDVHHEEEQAGSLDVLQEPVAHSWRREEEESGGGREVFLMESGGGRAVLPIL